MGKPNQSLNAAGQSTPIFLLGSLASLTTGSGHRTVIQPLRQPNGCLQHDDVPRPGDCVRTPDTGAVPTMPCPHPPSIQPLREYRTTVPGMLAITQDPLPAEVNSAAITALCEHLSAMQSRCPPPTSCSNTRANRRCRIRGTSSGPKSWAPMPVDAVVGPVCWRGRHLRRCRSPNLLFESMPPQPSRAPSRESLESLGGCGSQRPTGSRVLCPVKEAGQEQVGKKD